MKNKLLETERDLLSPSGDFPSISIILPLEQGFRRQQQLAHQLNAAKAQVKKTLAVFYPEHQIRPVLDKLEACITAIKLPDDRQSLILFISPQLDKIVYLRSVVPPRIIIDHSFEIRDLVREQLLLEESLVLLLSGQKAVLYHRKHRELLPVKFSVPWHIEAYKNDAPERVSNFSDPHQHKEVLLHKFLQHIDQGLGIALKAYPLSVYLIAPNKVAGHFKRISKHLSSITSCIHGNYTDAAPSEILRLLQADEEPAGTLGTDLKKAIERAASEKKLACGIREVWAAAIHRNAKLLLVEEDFTFPAHQGPVEDNIYPEKVSLNRPDYIKDATDDVIEKVINCGGDIRFVEHAALKDYGRVALIQYYDE